MTEDIDVLSQFETADIPQVSYETGYTKIIKAAKLLKNTSSLKIPRTFFKAKNYRAGLSLAARKMKTKLRAYEKEGMVYIWEVR